MKERSQNAKRAFGPYLQRKRREAHISIAEVSDKTCIRAQTLRSIEKEEHDHLPADIYVKGLLRSFARVVGADAGQAVERYEQNLREISAAKQAALKSRKTGLGGRGMQITVGGLILLGVALAYFTPWFGKDSSSVTGFSGDVGRATNPSKSEQRPLTMENPPADGRSDHSGALTSSSDISIRSQHTGPEPARKNEKRPNSRTGSLRPTGTTRYLLSIQVVADTWLKVIADDQEAVKYQLKTGDRLDLTAFTRFNILIGNARGVHLSVNGRPLPVTGKRGQSVNIDIP